MLCWGAEVGFVPPVRDAGGLGGCPVGLCQSWYGQDPHPRARGGTQGAVLVLSVRLSAPPAAAAARSLPARGEEGACLRRGRVGAKPPARLGRRIRVPGQALGLERSGSGVRSPRPPARWPCQGVLAAACQEPRGGGRSWTWGHRATHQVNKSPFMGTGGSWLCRRPAAGHSRGSVGQGTPCAQGDAAVWGTHVLKVGSGNRGQCQLLAWATTWGQHQMTHTRVLAAERETGWTPPALFVLACEAGCPHAAPCAIRVTGLALFGVVFCPPGVGS